MKVINLTLPLYPFMPVGNVWAWDSPFQLTPLMTPNSHGVSAYHMSFHSETGTRLMLAACYEDDAPKIHELDYRPLVNRPTARTSTGRAASLRVRSGWNSYPGSGHRGRQIKPKRTSGTTRPRRCKRIGRHHWR
jgi:hypothetical protein